VTGEQGLQREVQIPVDGVTLPGTLAVPAACRGFVIFAHGSGSSRHSPRNRFVAGVLHGAGIGTLLFDLLTEAEGGDRRLVFDIGLLADRLEGARRWLEGGGLIGSVPLGYFGASTGAAAALVAAAGRPGSVAAIVSRGGRPDLAGAALERVTAPTLLIVGGADYEVLELNRQALRRLPGPGRLAVVPGATHLFEEPGALEQVAELARDWFATHFQASPVGAAG
jgi:putative phosphoribosyl transferase